MIRRGLDVRIRARSYIAVIRLVLLLVLISTTALGQGKESFPAYVTGGISITTPLSGQCFPVTDGITTSKLCSGYAIAIGALSVTNNLSDLSNTATARANLFHGIPGGSINECLGLDINGNVVSGACAAPQSIACQSGYAVTSYNPISGLLGCSFVLPQQITLVSLSNSSIIGTPLSGTTVGLIGVTLAPASPSFAGTLSLSGTDAARFRIVGNSLETLGSLPVPGTYSINIVASGSVTLFNAPFTQPETIQAQLISTVSLDASVFTQSQPSGFHVANISVLMNAPSPAFSGNVTLGGTDAGKFQIVGSELQTNGVVNGGTYSITITASQGGGMLTQSFTVSAVPQVIQSVSLLNTSFVGGTGSANNPVGVVTVALSPVLPTFSGSISITGTNGSSFATSNGIVNVGSSNVSAGSYSINIVATPTSGSPFTQAETITGLTATTIQDPGPSAQLYDRPYYQCMRNFFVSATGNDAYSGTSPFTPWATIARADNGSRIGGDCINVAPGVYSTFNPALKFGGSTAANNGYVAYRCSSPGFISGNGSGCLVTGASPIAAGRFRGETYPNYLIFDGFNLVNTTATIQSDSGIGCSGPGSFNQPQTTSLGCHHWMILNNIIENHGEAAVTMGNTEFSYTSHNTVSQNAHQGCVGFYGSGIAYVVADPVSGYVKTADDTNSSNNQSLNWIGVQGTTFPFNQLIAWNSVANNYQGCLGTNNTDGNGIIIDTFNITSCNANQIDYPNQTLVAFNVAYNNGGEGVHVFASANVTVANNSLYQNMIDATLTAFVRPNMDVQCGASISGYGANTDLILNNVSVALPDSLGCGGANLGAQNPFNVGGAGLYVDANYNSPGKNITYAVGTSCNTLPASGTSQFQAPPNQLWNCTANQCFTNPLWADVGRSTAGSEATPPNGMNFALCTASTVPNAACTGASPAVGTGATESYLPAQSVDAGACSSTLTTCP